MTTRLEFLPTGSCKSIPQNYMGFRFIKQGNSSEIFTENEHEYLEWKRVLSASCILLHFHDYYNVDKMIGKGNFARVNFKFVYRIKKQKRKEINKFLRAIS